MILLVMVRRAFCEVCQKCFDLEPGTDTPEKCLHCGSKDWLYGPESMDSILIRQGIKFAKRRLNPGARSKKRQDQGRRQWRRFKPKPETA